MTKIVPLLVHSIRTIKNQRKQRDKINRGIYTIIIQWLNIFLFKNIFVTFQIRVLILSQEIWFRLNGEIMEVSYFGGYLLDSESFREVADCIVETSVKELLERYYYLIVCRLDLILDFSIAAKTHKKQVFLRDTTVNQM